MRVLLAHNFYRSSSPSGEDTVYREERALLEARGVEVIAYERYSDELQSAGPLAVARSALNVAWSNAARADVAALVRRSRPDIAHFHNTFPLISPSAYAACRDAGVPVVQTLHNFRMICPGAMLFRNDGPCEQCIEGSLLSSLRHRCYRNSLPATAVVAHSIALNRRRQTHLLVDRYLALTEFARSRFVAGGLSPEQIVVKPNGLNQQIRPGAGDGGYFVFVGRISREKGVHVLLDAWEHLPHFHLKIIGDGPLRESLQRTAALRRLNVEFLGRMNRPDLPGAVGAAAALIVPSLWYEGFPMTVVEAFASGTPVIASRLGSLAEIVVDGENGALFPAGDARALAGVVARVASSSAVLARMRECARAQFDRHYCADANFAQLSALYSSVLARRATS